MNLTQKLAITAIALGGTAVLGTGVYAAQGAPAVQDRMNDLVKAIATKFNVSESDVQKVFDEQREVHQTEMRAKHEEMLKTRLESAVKDGTLTQAQADLVAAKHKEFSGFMDTVKDMTAEERQTAMKTQSDALKQWAKDNNIPERFLPMGMGMGMGSGRGEMQGRGMGKAHGGRGMGAGLNATRAQ